MNIEIESRSSFRSFVKLLALSFAIGSFGLVGNVDAQSASQSGPYIVMLGAPGAGKSTHAGHIQRQFGIPVVEATAVLEDAIRDASRYTTGPQKNAAARRIQKARRALASLRDGDLVDDENLNALVISRISQADARNGFVIDGYPSTVEQALFLDGYLAGQEKKPLLVLFLDVPDEVSLERMKDRGRADDLRGFGKERLAQFRDTIAEVLDFYEGQGHLLRIDTTRPEAQVRGDIEAFIKASMKH